MGQIRLFSEFIRLESGSWSRLSTKNCRSMVKLGVDVVSGGISIFRLVDFTKIASSWRIYYWRDYSKSFISLFEQLITLTILLLLILFWGNWGGVWGDCSFFELERWMK